MVIIRYRRCRIGYGSASRITEAKTDGRKETTDGGGHGGDERADGAEVAVWPVAVGDQAGAPVGAPVPIPLTASGRKKSCPCSKARPPAGSGQRQLSSGWRRNPPAGSAPPSSAPCNAGYRTGGQSTVRIRRSTSPKSIHLAGRRNSTSTHCNSLGVTIGGRRYRHLLFQLVLSHSGWRYAEVVAGETFVALKQGLQNALWELGGAPQVIRSDNSSALTHEIKRSRGRALNDNYAELLDHYGARGHADQFRGIPREWRGRASSLPVEGRFGPGPHAAGQP